ncbi:PrsW family intramembrane metalloprotease [Neobacillus pocheonensis]|uniref:PrsW family intramembrane metalloprotease n=1 Tax=Neobacillus pocheonensis TaxID=363869 RepID=A0ABT0WAC2_9BACI|nr:PrsW family intramembrane metalloprotease [Neobacillus pocheonensis]
MAFETAGYALRGLLSGSFHMLYYTILWRSIFAPGGHVAWAALTGAAICMVQGDSKFQLSMLTKRNFVRIFVIVVFIHALWDSPLSGIFPFGQVILMVASWILVFRMIRFGQRNRGKEVGVDLLSLRANAIVEKKSASAPFSGEWTGAHRI